jgi:signal transduction histidine kinase
MSNLVSNACKFTPSGSVKIVTKLLFPRTDSTGNTPLTSPIDETADELGHDVKQIENTPHCSPGSASNAPPESSMSTDTDQTLTNMSDSHPVPVTVERIRQLRDARESTSSTRPNFGVRIPKKPAETKAIIRVEVHDTGVGLHKRDVIE